MTEKYLHQLWEKKRFLDPDLKLIDGRSLKILHFGYYNRNNEGPDFSMAVIEIDGRTYYGPVELHVNSSDWYRHGHQNDSKYDKVILHVVYHWDKDVVQKDRSIPVLELKNHIDLLHYAKQAKGVLYDQLLPCSRFDFDIRTLDVMKEWAIQKRLSALRKMVQFDSQQSLQILVARSFGMGENGIEWEKLIKGEAFTENFVRFGLRPQNRMEIRRKQLMLLIDSLDLLVFGDQPYSTFNRLIRSINEKLKQEKCPGIGNVLKKNIFVNAILPYLYICKTLYLDQVLSIMKSIAPESNHYTRLWAGAGFSVRTLFDSQGLLWLYKWKCSEKKCLTCMIGRETIYNDSKNSLLF